MPNSLASPELFVIARNSSFSFRQTPTDVKTISRMLGVRYVLEGSQQKSGNRLRVTVQLIDAVDGSHLWSETYERDLSDLFLVQDDIVRRVVATVAQKVISFEGRKAITSDSSKLSALLHHLEARLHLVKFTPEDNERARQANLAAINADPTQPFGYVGLAFVYINGHRWGWTDLSHADALDKARKAAQKAVELAPDYYDGHAAMAYVHLQDNDLDRAIARARRVLELNPNDTNGMCDLAEFLGYAGCTEEAERLLKKSDAIGPAVPGLDKVEHGMGSMAQRRLRRRIADHECHVRDPSDGKPCSGHHSYVPGPTESGPRRCRAIVGI